MVMALSSNTMRTNSGAETAYPLYQAYFVTKHFNNCNGHKLYQHAWGLSTYNITTRIHTSAIVEYNIQHSKFLSHEHITNNYVFDFNCTLYFSRYIRLIKKEKKDTKL